ncbi:hypothetical protein COU59_01910 [Candidatus Pacearchaeota archaeon CG10_big_fil_rev_8_21_14_0_10_34_12]|nr:MAG: hypothetical protein COU59_01910 [Candidatus Pacearchaeota archaeon CG10_big_fil_rev_8_21_14_0_10_34_12]
MASPLQINLPVMLHFEKEVQAFLEAKRRIETLGDSYDVPIDVGAFLLYLPNHARNPGSFEAQIENQRKHRLPIRLAETGVEGANGLSYGEGDPTYNPEKPSDMEKVIEQVAKLRDLDKNPLENLVVAPQVGILVADTDRSSFLNPCFYSHGYFVNHRDKLFNRARGRFSKLKRLAEEKGLTLALENALLAQFEDSDYWHTLTSQDSETTTNFALDYGAFNDFNSLMTISQRSLVFDVAHFAAEANTQRQFEANGVKPGRLFATMEISSWQEYHEAVGNMNDYLTHARAIHLSQVEGIGLRLAGTEEAERWGGGGALPPLIPVETQRSVLRFAQEKGLPVSLEPEYSLKPSLTYKEADDLLEPILRIYNS